MPDSVVDTTNTDERAALAGRARALYSPQEVSREPESRKMPANSDSSNDTLEHAFAGMCSQKAA
jgi:hypothetical protein